MTDAMASLLALPRDASEKALSDALSERLRTLDSFARRGVVDARTEYLKLVAMDHRRNLRREAESRLVPQPDGPSLAHFPPVTLDPAGIPLETFAPLTRHSYYLALHESDPSRHPLSTRAFSTRYDAYAHGATFMGSSWRLDPLRAAQLRQDPLTGRTVIHTLIVNETFEPRWGSLFCTDARASRASVEWQQDLVTHPVTVLIRLAGQSSLRYAGEWRFEKLNDPRRTRPFAYLKGHRLRLGVFGVTLASYDARWDAA